MMISPSEFLKDTEGGFIIIKNGGLSVGFVRVF